MQTITTPVLPDLDETIATQLGDDILMDVASTEKVARVRGGGRKSSFQSHESRAWTRGGNVD